MARLVAKTLLALLVTTLILVPKAGATSITFVGTSGNRSASATFALMGTTLEVTLTNTSLADVMQPVDVLTAVFLLWQALLV
jgi:hypothetical protein